MSGNERIEMSQNAKISSFAESFKKGKMNKNVKMIGFCHTLKKVFRTSLKRK